jgi:enoyl-CoA hydratase/carnithine racemase
MATAHTERRGPASVIFYDNPPTGIMTPQGAAQLLAQVQAAIADPTVATLVLTGGQPDVFIRHYDVITLLKIAEALRGGSVSVDTFRDPSYQQIFAACARAPKPVIAAINGMCMGGGLELALACDLRIAGSHVTSIGLPEITIGLFPGGSGTQRLPRIIGEARALEFILRGKIVDAAEALRIGLVHEMAEDPVGRALELAQEFGSRRPAALAAIKALMTVPREDAIQAGLAAEKLAFGRLLQTDDGTLALLREFVQGGGVLNI